MFLHSGASLHGHEYSNKPPTQYPPAARRNPLLRSSYTSQTHPPSTGAASSSSVSRASSFSSPATVGFISSSSSPASVIRSNTVTDGIRPARQLRANPHPRNVSESVANQQRPLEPVVRFLDPVVVASSAKLSLTTNTAKPPTPSGSKSRRTAQELMSEDESIFSASEASYASEQAPSSTVSSLRPGRRQRAPRKSATFLFAHPAPTLTAKKHILKRIRPRLLMQLQKLSPDHRPLPVIDVYPSSLLVGNVAAPRFSKRFPRLFGISGELGLHDTILVQSEDYNSQSPVSDSDGEEDSFEHRALLAVFSPLRRGNKSEIVLEDGTVWTTTSLPTGSFEFVRTDEHGATTTARWVRRVAPRPFTTNPVGVSTPDDGAGADPDCKYTFSIINPQSRRHPILATLTRVTLSILDSYTTVSPTAAGRYPPSRSWTQSPASHDTDASNDELSHDDEADQLPRPALSPTVLAESKGRTTLPVDEGLKNFITISSIWVSLQCGWGRSQATAMSHCPAGTSNPASGVSRSATGSLRSLGKVPDWQNGEPSNGSENADGRVRGRRLSAKYKTQSASFAATDVLNRDQSPSMSPRGVLRTPLFPRKTSSTGAAYVQRRKQLQQLSDTSDSERPAGTIVAPKRQSRTFSRLSGDFSFNASSKLHGPHSPSEASATPEVTTLAEVSRASSLREPSRGAMASSSIAPAFNASGPPRGGRTGTVSAYYASNPLSSSSDVGTAAPLSPVPNIRGVEGLDSDFSFQQQRPGSTLEHGNGKWKRVGNWLKSHLGGSH